MEMLQQVHGVCTILDKVYNRHVMFVVENSENSTISGKFYYEDKYNGDEILHEYNNLSELQEIINIYIK